MDLLASKLNELQQKYRLICYEINGLDNKKIELRLTQENLELEIAEIKRKITNLSVELEGDDHLYLYQDLNKIDRLHSVFKEDGQFTIELIEEITGSAYTMDIDCDIRRCKVTIRTGSKKVAHIIRNAFTNNRYFGEEEPTFHTKMNEYIWFSGPYGCTSVTFTYNKDIIKSLLFNDRPTLKPINSKTH